VIIATLFVVPPVALAQEAPPASGATGATGATGAPDTPAPTSASGPSGTTGATDPVRAPTITSDKADYPPGATVTLTGTNWANGELVHIVVNDTLGQTWKHVADVTADVGGSLTDVFSLPNYFVSDYDVTATGPTSGTATTTFTDAPKITAKQHEGQESVGTYTSGNITTYKEGDYINFHLTLEAKDAPATGRMEIRFTENDGTCLFFDGTFALGQIDNPYTGAVENEPAVVSLTGPTPTVSLIGTPIAQNSGTSNGEWVQTIEVSFSGDGTARLNYHLRLSNFAGDCGPGSSQHSRIDEAATNQGDFEATGAQNVPIPANQVIEIPEITVTKRIDRDGDGVFESFAEDGEYCFTLDGGACVPTNGSGQVLFTNVTPNGAHTITETQLDFTNGTYVFDSIVNVANCPSTGSTANPTVASGQTATDASCTFRNKANQGKIQLLKDFAGTPEAVTIKIGTTQGGQETDHADLNADGATSENTVNTGGYFVSEALTTPGNYTSSLACYNDVDDSDTVNAGDTTHTVNTSTGAVSVGSGDDVLCVFTNTRNQGKIELRKVWVGIPGQTTLNIGRTAGASNVDTQLTGSNGAAPLTTGENPVDTNTYFISEVGGLAGYSTSVACFNDIGGGTGGVANDGIKNGSEPTVSVGANGAVSVAKNADVVCTFTNTKFIHPGTIGFWKNWRNKYNTSQMNAIITKIKTDNPSVYNATVNGTTYPLTIAIYDAIFNYGNSTPREQQILGQLTGLKSNLAVSALSGNPPQYNDSICTSGVVNVSGISGAAAFFGTSTPTIGQVVTKVESYWTGKLTDKRSDWKWGSLTTAQQNIVIQVLTGINEGTIVTLPC